MNPQRVPTGGVEEDWARLWDKLALEWEYEPREFRLGEFSAYRPDFYLPEFKLFVEVTTVRDLNRKNRKLKRAQKLFPEFSFMLLTRHDYAVIFKGELPVGGHPIDAIRIVQRNLAVLLGFLPQRPLAFGHA